MWNGSTHHSAKATNVRIAKKLGISVHTVETYLSPTGKQTRRADLDPPAGRKESLEVLKASPPRCTAPVRRVSPSTQIRGAALIQTHKPSRKGK